VGGVLVIDDYDQWQGAGAAVDQHSDENDLPILLHRLTTLEKSP
jgi:hypothetical protein